MLPKARTFRDSLVASSLLSRTAFFAGDYYTAADRQVDVIKLVDTLSGEWVQLAGYRMMNGEYDTAWAESDSSAGDGLGQLARSVQSGHAAPVRG